MPHAYAAIAMADPTAPSAEMRRHAIIVAAPSEGALHIHAAHSADILQIPQICLEAKDRYDATEIILPTHKTLYSALADIPGLTYYQISGSTRDGRPIRRLDKNWLWFRSWNHVASLRILPAEIVSNPADQLFTLRAIPNYSASPDCAPVRALAAEGTSALDFPLARALCYAVWACAPTIFPDGHPAHIISRPRYPPRPHNRPGRV